VCHFLGLWVVGSLLGKTLDVDLLSLCRRGVVRLLVAMVDATILGKNKDGTGPFVNSDVVIKLKCMHSIFVRNLQDMLRN
jgi:hypothetical protein